MEEEENKAPQNSQSPSYFSINNCNTNLQLRTPAYAVVNVHQLPHEVYGKPPYRSYSVSLLTLFTSPMLFSALFSFLSRRGRPATVCYLKPQKYHGIKFCIFVLLCFLLLTFSLLNSFSALT